MLLLCRKRRLYVNRYIRTTYPCHSIRRSRQVQGCSPYTLEVRRTLEQRACVPVCLCARVPSFFINNEIATGACTASHLDLRALWKYWLFYRVTPSGRLDGIYNEIYHIASRERDTRLPPFSIDSIAIVEKHWDKSCRSLFQSLSTIL